MGDVLGGFFNCIAICNGTVNHLDAFVGSNTAVVAQCDDVDVRMVLVAENFF